MKLSMSMGEAIDILSILEVKKSQGLEVDDRYEITRQEVESAVPDPDEIYGLSALVDINGRLWDVEDARREARGRLNGKNGPLDNAHARIACINLDGEVIRYNKLRAELKREINEHYGSALVEEKRYYGE